jgi:hypothetical protein
MNDPLGDHSMGDDRRDVLAGHHKNGTDDRNDLKMGVNSDVNLCLRRSDLLDGPNLDDVRHGQKLVLMMDVSRGHRMNDLLDDRRDLNLVAKMDAMSHHVKLMVYLNTSCDRMSHDHLQCDHLMMHHRDTNRTDGMNLDGVNLDGKMKNSGAKNSGARMI